jgi:16S rRNA (uracil1498-N3)-methyltransferase
MRRFLCAPLPTTEGAPLPPELARHVSAVLRLKPGATMVLFDGAGAEVEAELLDLSGTVGARALGDPRPATSSAPAHLLLGVLKGPMMDDAVRMATEAGMTHLHPVLLARSVAEGDRRDRWARIAEGATRQSGRADVPHLAPPRSLADALAAVQHVPDRRIALPGGAPMPGTAGPVAVLIGAEGGFTDRELSMAKEAGFASFYLGPWVLRAATAAPIALAVARAAPS